MKRLLLIFFLFHTFVVSSTEIYDVYTQQSYRYNARIYTEKLKADYLPTELELTQAKIENPTANILQTEEKLKSVVLESVIDEFQYFKLQTLFKEKLKRVNRYYLLKHQNDEYHQLYEVTSTNQLKSIEIELLSIVNGFGTYEVKYEMEIKTTSEYRTIWNEEIISQYYIVHLQTGKIHPSAPLNSKQQQIVLASAETKLKKLYLLQTQKIKLSEIERIRNIDKEINIPFEQKIDLSEAIIYPYFSGVLVTFPSFTKSAELFENEPFRVFIQSKELPKFFRDFQLYKEIFNVPIQPVRQETIRQLAEDKNFDFFIFRDPPKALDLVQSMTKKPLRSLSILNYNQPNDSVSELTTIQKYYFNLNQTLNRYDQRDKNGKVVDENGYLYNENDQLIAVVSSKNEELEVYYYDNNHLSGKEKYHINIDYRFPKIEMKAKDETYFYISNYRYTFNYPMVGKYNHTNSYNAISYRNINTNSNCTNYYCFVLDDKKRIIGLEKSNYELVDILTDSLGRPKESYFNNGRESYFFDYDREGRIIQYQYLHDKKIIRDTKFQYFNPSDKEAVRIRITDLKAPQLQEYKIEFW